MGVTSGSIQKTWEAMVQPHPEGSECRCYAAIPFPQWIRKQDKEEYFQKNEVHAYWHAKNMNKRKK